MIKVIITDDHAIVRNGLRMRLENEEDISVIGEAENGKELIELLKENQNIVVLLDITMPVMDGIATLKEIQSKGWNQTKVIMLSMHNNEEYVLNSIELGACGYLLKENSAEELIKAIHIVSNGQRYYPPVVSEIMANGYLNKIKNYDNQESTDLNQVFSKREMDVLENLKQGKSNREIAEKLNLSIRTVEVHRFNMMKKTKSKNLVELLNKIFQ